MPAATRSWGILGGGRVAGLFAAALRRTPGARLLAVTSRTRAGAQAFAEAHGAPHAFDDLSAMLALPELDIVYVSTPNHLHLAQALAVLAAGKAVLVEKPLATTAAEAEAIAAAARAAGVFCMEAMWTQFVPAVAEAMRLVSAGAIGEPQFVSGSMGVPTHFDPRNRFFDPDQGGGALLDRGCYPISLALRALGPVAEVRGATVAAPTGVDASAAATLRHAGGGISQVAASLTAGLANDLVIAGTEGQIVLHAPITRPTELSRSTTAMVGRPGEEGGRRGARGALRALARDNRLLKRGFDIILRAPRFLPLQGNGYAYEIAEVHRCLDAGLLESPVVPLSLSIATLAVIDAVRPANVADVSKAMTPTGPVF